MKLINQILKENIIEKDINKFEEWETRNETRLMMAWNNYCRVVNFIPYRKFIHAIYNKNLPYVKPKSYRKAFK